MNRFLALFFLSQLHPRHSTRAVALGEIPPRNWDLPASLPALSRPHATAAPRRSSVAETARIFARLLQDIPAARSQRLLHQVHRSQRTAVFVQGKLLNGLLERTNQMSKTVFRKKNHLITQQIHFVKYIEPLSTGEATIEDSQKLWRNIQPILRDSMQSLYLREVG